LTFSTDRSEAASRVMSAMPRLQPIFHGVATRRDVPSVSGIDVLSAGNIDDLGSSDGDTELGSAPFRAKAVATSDQYRASAD